MARTVQKMGSELLHSGKGRRTEKRDRVKFVPRIDLLGGVIPLNF